MFSWKQSRTILLALLSITNASPIHLRNRRTAGLSVELREAESTSITAIVTNTGNELLHLFTGGTVLDDLPVRKVNVFQDGKLATFTGIIAAHAISGIAEEEFVTLAPGEKVESNIDLAETWELKGGDYVIQSIDAIPFSLSNSTELAGVYEYESNILRIHVDPAKIPKTSQKFAPIEARALLQCSIPSQRESLMNALGQAARIAQNGANSASGGNSLKFLEYFRTTSASIRSNVAARFRAIAGEASFQGAGSTTYYCQDPQNICKGSIIAYCLPARNIIANCPMFYDLPLVSEACGGYASQASTVLHEMTHAPGVFSPGTVDHAYGYSASTSLSSYQAIQNADTYALYADAVTLGC